MMNKTLLIIIAAGIVLFGCIGGGGQDATPTPVPTQPPQGTPVPTPTVAATGTPNMPDDDFGVDNPDDSGLPDLPLPDDPGAETEGTPSLPELSDDDFGIINADDSGLDDLALPEGLE